MERIGYGRGQGMGYKNLVLQDPYIHSLSAKGVKSKKPKKVKSKTPNLDMMQERTDLWSVMRGKGFRKNFGLIPTPQKKGLIRELARKVVDGTKWAIEWEKEHLPSQAKWVKDEFNKAKDEAVSLAKKGIEWEKQHLPEQKAWVKKEIDLAKQKVSDIQKGIKEKEFEKKSGLEVVDLQKAQDMHDVRDELDLNDDGIQDLPMSALENANKKIVSGLDKIDLNKDGVPDHQEEGFTNLSSIQLPVQPSYTEPSQEVMSNQPMTLPIPTMTGQPEGEPILQVDGKPMTLPIPTMTGEQEFEPEYNVEYEEPKMGIPFPMMTGEKKEPPKKTFLQKTGEFAKKEYELGKAYVKQKQLETRQLHQIPDNKLKQLAIEEGQGFMGGLNRYEKELIRREKEKRYLAKKLKEVDEGKESGSGIGNMFGFLNPVATLTPKQKAQEQRQVAQDKPLIPDALSFVNPLSVFKPSLAPARKQERYYERKLKPRVQKLNDGFQPFGFLNPIEELKTLKVR